MLFATWQLNEIESQLMDSSVSFVVNGPFASCDYGNTFYHCALLKATSRISALRLHVEYMFLRRK